MTTAAGDWVPMEWPAAWDAAQLELLKGTPVNCLLGAPEAAARAGFARPDESGVTKIEKCPWPGLAHSAGAGDSAGPTGNPWIDTNSWQVRLARARDASKPVWVSCEKVETENCALAAADAACCGGRWVVRLTDATAKGMVAGNASAMTGWKELIRALAFFEQHRDWAAMTADARLAIVSAFTDTNSGEVLNLATRQHLTYRVVEKSKPVSSFAGMEGVLYLDDDPPEKALLARMVEYARGGGLLLVPRPTAALIGGIGPVLETQPRTAVHRFGKGRLAMPLKEWDDPFLLASDVHLLLSYRSDPVRLFNAGLLIPYVTVADGGRRVVQIVNYAGRGSANFVSMALPGAVRSAKLWMPGAAEAKPMEIHRESGRPELHLPAFKNYAAIDIQ